MSDFSIAIVISAIDKATAPIRQAMSALKGLGETGERVRAAGEKMAQMGQVAANASATMREGFVSVMAPAMDLEDALAKVQTVITPFEGTVGDAMARVRQQALDWSTAHTDTAAKFVDTTYMMISAGLNEKAALEATKTAMTVAKATMGDSASVAASLATIYNNMGDKTADVSVEMQRLGDILTKTQQQFQLADMNQLTEGMKFAIPTALQYGMSIDQVSAIIGTLNSAGLQGGMAGTAFASSMRSMQKASKDLGFDLARTATGGVDFATTLANIEKKFGSFDKLAPDVQQKFQQAFGDDGLRALSLMMGKSGDLAKAIDAVGHSAGAAGDAQKIMEATTSGQWQILKNNIDKTKDSIAAQLIPVIQMIVPPIASAISWFGRFAEAHPTLTKIGALIFFVVMAVLSVVGAVLPAIGAMTMFGGAGLAAAGTFVSSVVPALISGATAAWGFAAALLANPITWIVIAIVAAALLIYKYWEPIKGFFTGLWDEIKAAFNQGFVQGLMKVLMFLSPVYWIARAFNAVTEYLFGFSLFEGGKKVLTSLWDGIKSVGSGALGFLEGIWHQITSSFDQGVLQGLMKLFELFSPIAWLAKALDAVTQYVSGFSLLDAGKNLLTSVWDGIRSVASSGLSILSNLWSSITSGFDGGVVQGIMHLLTAFNPVVWIAKSIDAIGQYLFGVSFIDAGAKMVNTIWEGIKSVANKPVEAMQEVVQQVRNLLPFSPAKTGPLRDLHRVKLVETVADAVRPAPLVAAMSDAAGAAMAAIPSAAQMPMAAPMPSFAAPIGGAPGAAGPGAAVASGGGDVHIHFDLNTGGAPVDAKAADTIEQMLARYGEKIAAEVQRQMGLRARAAF